MSESRHRAFSTRIFYGDGLSEGFEIVGKPKRIKV
jgi:hypothetical protein